MARQAHTHRLVEAVLAVEVPLRAAARSVMPLFRMRLADSNHVMTIYAACNALAKSPSSALFKSDTAQNDIPWWIQ